VKKALRSVMLEDARRLLDEVLLMDTSDQIQRQVSDFLAERGMAQFVPVDLQGQTL
jgi:signal transduction protein with GAF and PtsI domain